MKRSLITLVALGLGVSLVAAACGKSDKTSSSSGSGDKKIAVTIGAQDFGESAVLAEIYKQGLAAKGYTTSIKKLGGYRPVELDAFKAKEINFAPEYLASLLEALNNKKGEATGDAVATYQKLTPYLKPLGLAALRASSAVDTNAFVITKKTSDDLGIKTLSDLAAKGKDLKIGAPADCATNPFCLPGLKKTYGLDLTKNYTALESGQVADALDAGSVQIGLLFSTAGAIASKGYVLLDDNKHMLAADNVLPIVTTALATAKGFAPTVRAITDKLTTDKLIDMNKAFDIDKEDAAVIAKGFLDRNKLI
ncbi:MAG: osmoprotectant transport system substrate-binding protein [Actinomycetota bacterium]